MKEKNSKAIKPVKKERVKKDAVEETKQNLESRQVFKFDWDTVFRVLGSITGIAGISTVLLFLFGFGHYEAEANAMNIPIRMYISGTNELILLQGSGHFISFVFNVGVLLLIYFTSKYALNPAIRSILKRIKHPLLIYVIGIVLSMILMFGGIFILDLGGAIHVINQMALFVIPSIEILYATVEIATISVNATQNEKTITVKVASYFFKSIRMLILVGGIISLLSLQFIKAVNTGRNSGCRNLIETPTSVSLFSHDPMGLSGEISRGDYYFYEGYYLLFFDNNIYYLYREVDAQTLKPKSVYIINAGNFNAIELESVNPPSHWKFTEKCPEIR